MADPILVNGHPADVLPVTDRGLQYGDGLFETVAVRDGRLLSWPRHMARLAAGCERLAIPIPDAALLTAEAATLAEGRRRATIKLIVTRGSGPRGYRPPADPAPTRIVALLPDSGGVEEGAVVTICRTRLGRNPALAGIKHLNRLEQILARSEWGDGYDEGLMADDAGNLIEGTMSNVFLVRDNALHTPDLSLCGVAGVMRAAVLDAAAALGVGVRTGAIELAAIDRCDGLFLCNSLIGIRPVVEVAGRRFEVPPVVVRLRERLAAMEELP